ncbi:hypothetical protein MK805_02300 [Shimazuella sp. AN120528]|uniref:hypothetical protein n=1 Tax=Shimazuella soli TaxID=1892854 RepID=UPI001F100568|nr:hypothetical protein [Shimazuella soli]MCH5583799.1 hypothetical protein [Shimazuella soli]
MKHINELLREDPAPLPLYWFTQKKVSTIIIDSKANSCAIKAPVRDKADEIIAKMNNMRNEMS